MPADLIQARYDELERIVTRLGNLAETNRLAQRRIAGAAKALSEGGWQGEGAAAFAAEMNGTILPAIQRLTQALDSARAVTLQVIEIFRQAEAEASAVFKAADPAAQSPTTGNGAAAGAEPSRTTPTGAATGNQGISVGGTTPAGPRERGVLDIVDRVIRGSPGRPHTGVRFWTGAASAARGSAKLFADRRYWRSFMPLVPVLRGDMVARNILPPLAFRPLFGNPANVRHPAWLINHLISQPPKSMLEKVVGNPLVKGVGKVLTVANFAMSSYDLARDLNQGYSGMRTPGKIGDVAASAIGLGAMVGAGTPAGTMVLGPFAAGFGIGKLGDWATGKVSKAVGRLIGNLTDDDSLKSYGGFELSDIGSLAYKAIHSAQPGVRAVDFLHDYVRGHGTADEQRIYSNWLHTTRAYRQDQLPNTPVPQLKVFAGLGAVVRGANTGASVSWEYRQGALKQ